MPHETDTFSFRIEAFRAAKFIDDSLTDQQIIKNLDSNGYAVKDDVFYLKTDLNQPCKPPSMIGNYTVENFDKSKIED